jgi:hypothetical protein
MAFLACIIGLLNMLSCNAQNKNLMGQGEKVLVIGRHTKMLTTDTHFLTFPNKIKSLSPSLEMF